MNKKIKTLIKINVKAQQASPTPPIGPALGQHGVNIMSFCKEFNEKTKNIELGMPLPVVLTVYIDKSFKFIIKKPATSYLIKKQLGIDKGSNKANEIFVSKINMSQLTNIAKTKIQDLTASSLNNAINTIKGTAISMGVKIENDK